MRKTKKEKSHRKKLYRFLEIFNCSIYCNKNKIRYRQLENARGFLLVLYKKKQSNYLHKVTTENIN